MKRFFLAVAVCASGIHRIAAQPSPSEHWRTLDTRHFHVHFTPALEELARRSASNAELAYAGLASELVPPRGPIDLVITDNADFVNGYATPFPTNRIVIYAHPATDNPELRNYQDWSRLVITHELTHIFHLDRARGIWRLGQAVFGRNPLLFPNVYSPSWVSEGLAVYYESRLTGGGRLESGHQFMVARAAALGSHVPRLNELSRGTTRFPGGEVVYVYGSLLFDYLSRTRGPDKIREFVEKSSSAPLPFLSNRTARAAFGISFETGWKQWSKSLRASTGRTDSVMPGWREITADGRVARSPRWLDNSTIAYGASNGRETPGLYVTGITGTGRRISRRNSAGANLRMPDGSLLFSQPELLGPYLERSDLWKEKDGRQFRLTYGARLHSPDVRADGAIVAVQNLPGTTRLVRVSQSGHVTAVTAASLDAQWAEPRWRPGHAQISAIRISRAAGSEIVVLDTLGTEIVSLVSAKAVTTSPSWTPDGCGLLFSSERGEAAQIYFSGLLCGDRPTKRLSTVATGLFEPELSPDGKTIASVIYRADGYHIGIAPFRPGDSPAEEIAARSPRSECAECVRTLLANSTAGVDSSKAHPYSALASLLPRYWFPVLESTSNYGTAYGASTSGADVIGRHAYAAQLSRNTRFAETSAWLAYRFAGLGTPFLDFTLSQDYSHAGIFAAAVSPPRLLGTLSEGIREATVQATFVRPRFRTYSYMALGGGFERKLFTSSPDSLLARLGSRFRSAYDYPSLFASAGWRNTQRPALSISPEDGVALSASVRQRWPSSSSSARVSTRSLVTAASAYKSLDLPGFSHHALAVRGAYGITDTRTLTRFSAGGVSGSPLALLGGSAIGEPRRTFGVRGYPAGAEAGIRAAAATVEYRVPLSAPSRGYRFIPLFIDRTSLSVFSETGRAYCPMRDVAAAGVCSPRDAANGWMRSVGAELGVDTGVQVDIPATLRFGVAFPLAERERLGARSASVYVTFGSSF